MFHSLLEMAKEDHKSGCGDFVYYPNIDTYWEKLQKKAEFIVHLTEGQSAGFIAFYCNDEKKEESFISLMLVSPRFRKKSIATNLVHSVLSITRLRMFTKCALEVEKDNYKALSLYKKMGFSITEERELSYIMKKTV